MSARLQRLLERLPEAGVDAMLVTDLINVRYLTGYSGSNGVALLMPDSPKFLTDFRYVEQAAEEVDAAYDRPPAALDLLEAVGETLPPGDLRLGYEDAHISVWDYRRLRERLPERVELVAVHGLVEGLRRVKGSGELARIKAATVLADEAFQALLEGPLAGVTEHQVAVRLDHAMRERGATGSSFPTIVAAGANGARPHARPRDVEIGRGDLVVIDWGAELDGYFSDCTRTIAAGDPGEDALAAYDLVLRAQLTGLQAVRAGAGGREVDGTARAVIEAGGQGERFGHGLGHGVGLEVHEPPRLSQSSEDVLASGNVVTVEPGVYAPGQFGVRIEDLVVVTEDGCEILTSVSKELSVVE
ncbi:MAG: Xaa-Pro peptidase family protein [Actinomycetota bacterium]|nr:Xaa-Pro peptidase family protein [Actinomycetota bacterium]